MNNSQREELRDYILGMFKMVWRDAEYGIADKLTVVGSAADMIMRRIDEKDVNAQIKAVLDRLEATSTYLGTPDGNNGEHWVALSAIQQERARLDQVGDGGEVSK